LFALPPEVPEQRVQAIRKAFDATLNDPEYNQDMNKAGIYLRPIPVKRVEEVVSNLLSMPRDERQEIKNILGID
jgi:tripartite-type tricarboxylate transporter receptor subunit TctC